MFGRSLSLLTIFASPSKRTSETLERTFSEAVAVKAVTTGGLIFYITFPRFKYAGLKESPHSLTQ